MSGQLTAPKLTVVSTEPETRLGAVHWDPQGRKFQYCKVAASTAIAQYEYVKVSGDGNFSITSLTTTTNPSTEPAAVGCVQADSVASSSSVQYLWVFRGYGYHIGKFAASCVQDVKIYTTATAGVVDDASTTLINGLKLITTITSAAASPAFAVGELQTVAA